MEENKGQDNVCKPLWNTYLLVATVEKHPVSYCTGVQVHETMDNCTVHTMVPLHPASASQFTLEPQAAFPVSS
jgi:hypothetical protein